KLKLRPIIITLTIWFASCNECKEFDCFQTFPEISFHYLSNSNEDLLDGPTKKYNLTDFELFSIDELNNKYISDLRFTGQFSGQNAFITATIKNDILRNYLKVKGQLTDTLDFQFRLNIATECCGESLIITTTSLNNQTVDSYHILTLKERN
ncbi:MAG: hypothetical protein L6Q51_14565, partial [Cyclobacteriaceae bacterium]|nr:hypothetical protein [Cyclobacteriaceae bacterium]